ncbi:phosphocholine cytidylyltransferase family protein [Sphingomonas parva]|uniref:Phosphocholine cytidylyltransferase family protein n=1 Tax=Sphingomonas parva TaxID=2555898 RepID=A0A4Y8ZS95_9SPHN|nr:phosphocholine cytidylyltransferase family protein [Sphingomonas parva]TFI58891.1 phosphocholine cytidylyltransferase family protein [Sphingomonas parva]
MPIQKAILLSAGKGSRLLPLTADRPKCLIEFSGKSLLEWQLDTLLAAGIGEIVVVTGFREELVEAVAATRAGVRTLFNPFYHVADNLGSVWMARHELSGELLLLNGDTLVSPALLARVLAAGGGPIAVTTDEKPSYDADDMKVLTEGDRLLRIGKTLEAGLYNGESIGLLAFRGGGAGQFAAKVEAMMRRPEGTRRWYLRAIDELAQEGADVRTVSIRGEDWQEVDFPEDLARAEALTARWAASITAEEDAPRAMRL